MASYIFFLSCIDFRHNNLSLRRFYLVSLGLLLTAWLGAATLAHAALPDRTTRPAAQVNPGHRFALMDITAMGNRLLSVGERGRILISSDQGASWRQAQVPVSVFLTAVTAATDEIAWAVGHDGTLIKTSDRGENWRLALDGTQINQLIADDYPRLLASAEADPNSSEEFLDELRFRTEDAQLALQDKHLRTLLDVAFVDADNGYVLGAYGLLLATQDGGRSWQPMLEALDNPDGFHLNSIAFSDTAVLIAGEAGTLFRRRYDDDQWQTLDSPYEGSFFGVHALGDDRLVVYGLRGNAFISDDGGDNWQQLQLPLNRTLTGAAQLEDGTLVLVGSFGAVLVKPPGQPFRMQRLAIPAPSMSVLPLPDGRIIVVGLAGAQPLALSPVVSTSPSSAKQGN
ncbi:MAG: YCF48-related protein [Motiliproteus sp.]